MWLHTANFCSHLCLGGREGGPALVHTSFNFYSFFIYHSSLTMPSTSLFTSTSRQPNDKRPPLRLQGHATRANCCDRLFERCGSLDDRPAFLRASTEFALSRALAPADGCGNLPVDPGETWTPPPPIYFISTMTSRLLYTTPPPPLSVTTPLSRSSFA
jgi:hypothetical protein